MIKKSLTFVPGSALFQAMSWLHIEPLPDLMLNKITRPQWVMCQLCAYILNCNIYTHTYISFWCEQCAYNYDICKMTTKFGHKITLPETLHIMPLGVSCWRSVVSILEKIYSIIMWLNCKSSATHSKVQTLSKSQLVHKLYCFNTLDAGHYVISRKIIPAWVSNCFHYKMWNEIIPLKFANG